MNNNPNFLDNRNNQRENGFFDFANLIQNINGFNNAEENPSNSVKGLNIQNINNNYNDSNNNTNNGKIMNNVINGNSNNNSHNSECLEMPTHLFLQSQNQNLNSNCNNNLNNNSSNNNNNNNKNNCNNAKFSNNNCNFNNSNNNVNDNINNICSKSINSMNNNINYDKNNNNNSNNLNNNNYNENNSLNNMNGSINKNTNFSNKNSNNNNHNLNLSSLLNLGGNNGLPDFIKASSLISELISLEQQNRVQIDLIQKIIDSKHKNNSSINSALLNMLAYNNNNLFGSGNADFNKNEIVTTNYSSRGKNYNNTKYKNNDKSSFNTSRNGTENQLKIKFKNVASIFYFY